MAMSDAESDSYSLLEVPRPRVQEMLQRSLAEGRLAQLVLNRTADLSRAIVFSLEVLGLGTSTAEEQAAAGKALQELCTHVKLRPAVDNLLVLRRLCRIIELTDSAVALTAAVDALFTIADDAAWQTKGGGVADVVHDALLRCVGVLSKAAKDFGQPSDPRVSDLDSAAGITETDAPDSLAAAAASVLKLPVLSVLRPSELEDAARALSACLAAGMSHPKLLVALAAVLQHSTPASTAAAAAVVDAGAVPVLVRIMAADLPTSTSAAKLTGPASAAFSALRVVVLLTAAADPTTATSQRSAPQALAAGAMGALVPCLHLSSRADTTAALHILLVLASSGPEVDRHANITSLTELLCAGPQAYAALAAAEILLSEAASHGQELSAECGEVLLRIVVRLLEGGMVVPEQLQARAPQVVQRAIAVLELLGHEQPCASCMTATAAAVVSRVLAWAAADGAQSWTDGDCIKGLAAALIECVARDSGILEGLGEPGVQCLSLSLQLAAPDGSWMASRVTPLTKWLVCRLEASDCGVSMLQLATVALVYMFHSSEDASECGKLVDVAKQLLSREIAFSSDVASHSSPSAALAVSAGLLNAVLAALCPRHALTGEESALLLPRLARSPAGSSSGPANIFKLSPRFAHKPGAKVCDAPITSAQLQWYFEKADGAPSMADVFNRFGEHYHNYAAYRNSYSNFSLPTVSLSPAPNANASATAEPFLQALVAATSRVTQLVGELVGTAACGPGGEAAAVVRAAVKVAGNAAAVLAACVPPAVSELRWEAVSADAGDAGERAGTGGKVAAVVRGWSGLQRTWRWQTVSYQLPLTPSAGFLAGPAGRVSAGHPAGQRPGLVLAVSTGLVSGVATFVGRIGCCMVPALPLQSCWIFPPLCALMSVTDEKLASMLQMRWSLSAGVFH